MSTTSVLDSVGRDLLYAVRATARNRTVTVVVVLTLALAIGSNTALFSVLLGPVLHDGEFEVVAWRSVTRVT